MRRVLILTAALALAGCTQQPTSDTGDFTGEEKKVAELVGDLSSAASRGEQATVCGEILSKGLQEKVKADSSCVSEVEKAFKDADAAIIDVEAVTVTDDTAEAVVSSKQVGADVERTFSFVKENGDWRIDSFG